MQTKNLILKLFEYKAWANNDLYGMFKALPSEAHTKEKHDATRILNHIYVVDQIFKANVQREKHTFTGVNTLETPTMEALHHGVQKLDQWYIDYVKALTEDAFGEAIDFTFVDGKAARMTRGEMLMHVITHGGYHRGAAGRFLVQIDVSPPRDTLTVFMHRPKV
jgi:uncharacterized damage-inducible protein DinB